jgi:hypothetical protein
MRSFFGESLIQPIAVSLCLSPWNNMALADGEAGQAGREHIQNTRLDQSLLMSFLCANARYQAGHKLNLGLLQAA